MKYGITALLACVVLLLMWSRYSRSSRDQVAPEASASALDAEATPVAKPPFAIRRVNPVTDEALLVPEGIGGKLQRLYGQYMTSPNRGYSNVLAAIAPLSIEDPMASDLFKDACGIVAFRTEIAGHINEAADDLRTTREWLVRKNPDPQAQSDALERFEKTRPMIVENLLETDKAVQRIFSERFTHRYGLDGELVLQRLNGLVLSNAGPELWIRCDETVSPYPTIHRAPSKQ